MAKNKLRGQFIVARTDGLPGAPSRAAGDDLCTFKGRQVAFHN